MIIALNYSYFCGKSHTIMFYILMTFFVMEVVLSEPTLSFAPSRCATYDPQLNVVHVVCDSNLSAIGYSMEQENILYEESKGVWVLNAVIDVSSNSSLVIDSRDTRWLKITNDGDDPNFITISGKAKVDGVKITSWNLTDNRVIEQNQEGSTPRSYLRVEKAAGTVDILNSEIAFLGYNSSLSQGLTYYGGRGSTISNSTFHDMWYAFYSFGIGFVTISNNHYYDNLKYAIDPHTGSHDLKIVNNNISNSRIGVICSHDCYNILIEDNKIYDGKIGVMFSHNTFNSIARSNYIYGASTGIAVSESYNNEIYDNTVEDSNTGIKIHRNSSANYIHHNTVAGGTYGLNLRNINVTGNLFENNILSGMTYGVRVSAAKANDNLFTGNNISSIEEYEYYISHDASLHIRNQTFANDNIRGGSGFNIVEIFSSGKITGAMRPVDTDSSKYVTVLSGTTITIDAEYQ